MSNWPLYSSIDGAVTSWIWDEIAPDLINQGYEPFYKQTMRLYEPLIYMMTRGVRIDKDALEEVKKETENQIEELQDELNAVVGEPLNANSPKQCVAYFYGKLGLPPYKNKSGGLTVDDKALARLARKGVKAAPLVQSIRARRKILGTYLEVVPDSDGRLRSSFNPRGTKNGRLSSSKTIFGTGLNFQNLPTEFKHFIVPDPGHLFLEFDKRQAEWVVSAYASGDPRMIQAIENGDDVHVTTAELITGVSKDLIVKDNKLIGSMTDRDEILRLRRNHLPEIFEAARFLPGMFSCRQGGKKSNHALNYKEGYVRFALENEIPETEARVIVNGYRNGYSHLPMWWERTEMDLRMNDRTLTNCFGQKRRFLDEWGHSMLGDAIAYVPQSTVVYVVNDGMINAYEDHQDFMYLIDLLCQVHDSILIQYPIKEFDKMLKMIQEIKRLMDPEMEYSGRRFHIATDLKISAVNWADMREINLDAANDDVADQIGDYIKEYAA